MSILGIGTDIVECLRIAQMIERHGELFIARVYTDHEIEYCRARKAATQHYAGRWAAKEAVLKALGTAGAGQPVLPTVGSRRGISWQDIEIRNERHGSPSVNLRGAARDVYEEAGIHRLQVSISHCRTYAMACAIAEGEEH